MKIGILGGGIGGLSTAIALKQEGLDVTVYERHHKPAEIGAGIVCWPNACFVLEKLGVLKQVSAVSGLINYMNRYTQSGDAIGTLDINELNRMMNYPSLSVIRKDLMEILVKRVADLNVQIRYQHEVISFSNNHGRTQVRFKNGDFIEPDLIIGSDGRMNSIARKYVLGANAPKYQGFINWVGVFEQEEAIFSDLSVSDYWGVGERFGIVPVSNTKAYWAGGAVSEHINQMDPKNYQSELLAVFKEWPDLILKIINETPKTLINKIYVHDHDPIEKWHRHNVVLLGDAAHAPLPTSGQGACQALEDAWHLSQCLKENKTDLANVLTSFTALRAEKTAGITMGGRQMASSIFNKDATFCEQRNSFSKDTDYKKAVTGMAKGWSSGLPLY